MSFLNRLLTVCAVTIFTIPQVSFAQGDIFGNYEKRRDSAITVLKQYPQPDTARIKALIGVFLQAKFFKAKKRSAPLLR